MDPVTKPQLRAFCRFCIEKGLMNRHTGLAGITAVDSLLEQYADADDVSGIDVSMEGIQFNNRHPGKMAPGSLQTYQSRLTKVMTEYRKYVTNPSGYKPPAQGARTSVAKRPSATKEVVPLPMPSAPAPHFVAGPNVPASTPVATLATEHALALPFPLRPAFLAQVVIPRDMTREEANRLCAFIQALGQGPTVEVQQ